MFAYPMPSILTHFHRILFENLSNPIRINPKSIEKDNLSDYNKLPSIVVYVQLRLLGACRKAFAGFQNHGIAQVLERWAK